MENLKREMSGWDLSPLQSSIVCPLMNTMEEVLTIAELEARWANALAATHTLVRKHPGAYHELKILTGDTVNNPVDIKEYLPTVERIVSLLKTLDPSGQGSIFHFFYSRISPSSIWQISQLRLECRDLLDHLNAFEKWRIKTSRLRIVQ